MTFIMWLFNIFQQFFWPVGNVLRVVAFQLCAGAESPAYTNCRDSGIDSGLHVYTGIAYIGHLFFSGSRMLHDFKYDGRIRFGRYTFSLTEYFYEIYFRENCLISLWVAS